MTPSCSRAAGPQAGLHGGGLAVTYREIERPHRLVSTEMCQGVPDPEPEDYSLNAVTLEEDGVTTMTVLVKHRTKEARDMVLASGMQGGMQVSYDRLEDLVRERAA